MQNDHDPEQPLEREEHVNETSENVVPELAGVLATYTPEQRRALTRYGRLRLLYRDVLPKLDPSDFRVKLTHKALYSTYRDLEELGLEAESKLLREGHSS
jgi:hypothetical protein